MTKMTAEQLNSRLNQFTGTENWHRYNGLFPKMLLTDGALYLAENAGAYWIFDAICSHQRKALKDPMLRNFQFWTLKVSPDKKAVLTCERDSNDIAITQKLEYTDFPLPEIKIWVQPIGDGNYCAYLPSEH